MNPTTEWSSLIAQQQAQVQQHPVFTLIAKTLSLTGKVAPNLSGKWFNKLWFKPQSMPIKSDDKSWLTSASTEWITYKQQKIPVYRWGKGPAVLCVHGWGGHSGQFTPMIKTLVDKGFQVIAFDGPAHGQAEGQRTDLTEFSDLIEILIRTEKEPVHIVAHSMGGIASVDVLNRGVPALSLTLIGTPLSLNYILEVTQAQMGLSNKIMNAHKRLMEKKYGSDVWQRYNLLESRNNFSAPLLLVYDQHDTQVLYQVSNALQQHWPHNQSITTEGLGHNRLLRNDGVISGLLRFLTHST